MKFRSLLQEFQKHLIKEYWGSEGAGILAYAQDTGKFLLSFRSGMVASGNTWGVIGGAIKGVKSEKNVTPKQGALKEFGEETGYDGSFLSLTPLYTFQDKDFQYHTFLGIIPEEFTPWPSKKHAWENSWFSWYDLDEMLELPNKHFGVEKMLLDKSVVDKLRKVVGEEKKDNL